MFPLTSHNGIYKTGPLVPSLQRAYMECEGLNFIVRHKKVYGVV